MENESNNTSKKFINGYIQGGIDYAVLAVANHHNKFYSEDEVAISELESILNGMMDGESDISPELGKKLFYEFCAIMLQQDDPEDVSTANLYIRTPDHCYNLSKFGIDLSIDEFGRQLLLSDMDCLKNHIPPEAILLSMAMNGRYEDIEKFIGSGNRWANITINSEVAFYDDFKRWARNPENSEFLPALNFLSEIYGSYSSDIAKEIFEAAKSCSGNHLPPGVKINKEVAEQLMIVIEKENDINISKKAIRLAVDLGMDLKQQSMNYICKAFNVDVKIKDKNIPRYLMSAIMKSPSSQYANGCWALLANMGKEYVLNSVNNNELISTIARGTGEIGYMKYADNGAKLDYMEEDFSL